MKLKSKLIILNTGLILLISLTFLIFFNIISNQTKARTIKFTKETLLEDRKDKVQSIVNLAYTYVESLYKNEYGKIPEEEFINKVRLMLMNSRYEGTNYVWIHTFDTETFIAHVSPALDKKHIDIIGNDIPKLPKLIRDMNKLVNDVDENFYSYDWPKAGEDKDQPKLSYIKKFKPLNWVFGTGIYTNDIDELVKIKEQEINESTQKNNNIILITTGIIITISLFLTLFFSINLIKPLNFIVKKVGEISSGASDLTQRLPVKGNDEIAILTQEFNDFIDYIQDLVIRIKAQGDILNDDVNQVAASIEENSASINEMESSFKSVKKILNIYQTELDKNSNNLKKVINEVKDIDSNLQIQNTEISQISGAIEELDANSKSVKKNTESSMEITDELVDISKEGRSLLQNIFNDFQTIGKDAEEILEISKLIQDIADQTNLLSMNASIEASHAGEMGKGFNVVAGEIRKLAENSGESAKKIDNSLNSIVEKIYKTVERTRTTSDKFENLFKNINKVGSIVNEVSNSTIEQTQAIGDILNSTSQLLKVTEKVKKIDAYAVESIEKMETTQASLKDVSKQIHIANHEQALGIENINKAVSELASLSTNMVGVNKELELLIGKFIINQNKTYKK